MFKAGRGAKVLVRAIDHGLKRIQASLKSITADRTYVKAGLLGTKARKPRPKKGKGGREVLSNVDLGIIHEFGRGNVPARPFIGASFRKHRAEYFGPERRADVGVR